jgi:hypothetical protein
MKALMIGVALVLLAGGAGYSDDGGKSFKPASGQANVYIARKTETMGALLDFEVVLDGKDVVKLKGGAYTFLAVTPGSHKIEIKAGTGSTTVVVNSAEGKNYYYEAGAKPKTALLTPELLPVLLEPMGQLMVKQAKYSPSS